MSAVVKQLTLPVQYIQTLRQYRWPISAKVQELWRERDRSGFAWPVPFGRDQVPRSGVTVSIPQEIAARMDWIGKTVPGFSVSYWFESELRVRWPNYFPRLA